MPACEPCQGRTSCNLQLSMNSAEESEQPAALCHPPRQLQHAGAQTGPHHDSTHQLLSSSRRHPDTHTCTQPRPHTCKGHFYLCLLSLLLLTQPDLHTHVAEHTQPCLLAQTQTHTQSCLHECTQICMQCCPCTHTKPVCTTSYVHAQTPRAVCTHALSMHIAPSAQPEPHMTSHMYRHMHSTAPLLCRALRQT